MVTTTILAVTSPKLIAPAMNTAMYDNPIVQDNMKKLKTYGYQFIDPAEGLLACGDTGRGKLADVEDILSVSQGILMSSEKSGALAQEIPEESENGGTLDFEGRTVVVTAGPTREALDPVRYITNHSSGKMGYSLAEAAAKRGAKVVLISGPTALKKPENENISFVPVVSASDMAEAVFTHFEKADILIMAAALREGRYPDHGGSGRGLHAEDGRGSEDQEGGRGDDDRAGPDNGHSGNAERPEERRPVHLRILDGDREPAGFGHDTNKVTIIARDGEESLPLISKAETADRILDAIIKRVK